MAITNKTLTNADAQEVFTSMDPNGDAVTTMYFCNTGVSDETFNIFLVPNGGTADPTLNIVYQEKPIAAGDTYVIDWEKLILSEGDGIYANCSANIIATVSTLGC